ncbi:MAG TPA: Sec-independent protein translocase subunit TatA [Rhodanobacteraceae bacterium]|nr:Sec-independent protein translocase subunit TatA [Rhodanobacteraceae bacterium]
MGLDSIWHWIILLVIVLAVFGAGKLTRMGPDLGNAVRGFKKALQGGDEAEEAKDAAARSTAANSAPPAADAGNGAARDAGEPK